MGAFEALEGAKVKILCDTQRTDDWFEVKKGKVSASDMGKVLAGKHTKGRHNYIETIASDLEGIPDFDDHDLKPWFEAGVFYEEWAIGWYQFHKNVDVAHTGFVVHDEYEWLGCSPDGLVGDSGLVEAKFRHRLSTFDKAVHGSVPRNYFAQMQTQLFVTDREWVDYLNYWRDTEFDKEKGHVLRVYRDQSYIENTLLPAILAFWKDVQAELRARKRHRETRSRL